MITLEVVGTPEVMARLGRIAMGTPINAGASLYRVGESIMTDSKAHYVPVDQGVLRASGYVAPPVEEPGAVSVTLGFGGPAQAYAEVQHERLDYHHKVGQAKYLEIPTRIAMGGPGQLQMAADLQLAIASAQTGTIGL